MSRLRQVRSMLQGLHLALAAYELRVAVGRPALQTSAQRPQPGHFVDFQWLANSFNASGPERLECEVSLNKLVQRIANRDRARRCQPLEAGCDTGGVSNR